MNRMSWSPPQLFRIHWRNFRIHFFFSFGHFRLKTPPRGPWFGGKSADLVSVTDPEDWCFLRLLLQVLRVLCCWLPQWIQEEPICPDRLTCSPTGTTLEGSSTTRPGCRLRGWRRWGFVTAYCCVETFLTNAAAERNICFYRTRVVDMFVLLSRTPIHSFS